MRLYFDQEHVLHIEPKNDVECMALKYWLLEYREHGSKVLQVDTVIPKLPASE